MTPADFPPSPPTPTPQSTTQSPPPPDIPPADLVPSTLQRDLVSAYAASAARVASWVVVSALVYRASPFHFAMLALVRGTLVLLNYTSVGLAPALVRVLAEARTATRPALPVPLPPAEGEIDYARPMERVGWTGNVLSGPYVNGFLVALAAAAGALVLLGVYTLNIHRVHNVPVQVTVAGGLGLFMGIGVVLRLVSEAPSAVVQTAVSISRDNWMLVISEAVWVGLTLLGYVGSSGADSLLFGTGLAYAASGAMLLLARMSAAARVVPGFPDLQLVDRATVGKLLGLGSLVAIAQLADFLYAPVDYILINRYVSPRAVASYAPVVQVNGALLLLVGGLSAVVLPRAALAHAAGDAAALRRYYVRGTLAAAGMLLAASVTVWALAPWLFRLWLGDPLPAAQAVLPLVLVHTVLGGIGGVGRAVLLAAGKARPYALAVLTAGVLHVALSYVFVRHLRWGLQGVALGTVAAAVGLCVIWQPWFVLRTLARMKSAGDTARVPVDEAVASPATSGPS